MIVSKIQTDKVHCIRQIHTISLLNNTLKFIESVTGMQALHSILSFEFKSDYITSNYKVLTITITVHVCVDITVKLKNPVLVHPTYSEQIVHPVVSLTTRG